MLTIEDKIKGAFFGVAIGDALGAPLEFMNKKEIQHKYGTVKNMIGGGWLNVDPGEITDDTQMTLAVAKGIIECPDAPEPYVGKYFIDWLKTNPKDVGRTCRVSINNVIQTIKNSSELNDNDEVVPYEVWSAASKLTVQKSGRKTAGNGALMRTVYPGLFYTDEKKAVRVADRIGRMTHWDDSSAEACLLYTKIILYFILHSSDPIQKKVEEASDILTNTRYDDSLIPKNPNPTGYVVDSFYCALHCLYSTTDFKSALIMAVNMGGDADTIGAITGGLAGALYGYKKIPFLWYAQLDEAVRKELDDLVQAAVKNHI